MATGELTRLQRVTYRVWLAVGVVLLGIGLFWVLARPLAVVVPPLLVALLLVYLLNPIVSGLHRLKIPRLLGTLIAFAALVGLLVGLGALVGPPLAEQLRSFGDELPELGEQLTENITGWLGGVGIQVDVAAIDMAAAAEEAQDFLTDPDTREMLLGLLGGLSGLATGVVTVALAIIVGPFIAAYLLWDMPRVRRWAQRLIPPQHRDEVNHVGRRLSLVVGGYIRGQILVATYVGVASAIGLALVGLPFWLVLGFIAGITNLVPLIGPFIAGALGAGIALITDGVGLALVVIAVMVIVQQSESQIVAPLVMGRTVRLHPLVVLLALLVAGTLYGLFGLIVAVPIVAAANVLVGHLWSTRVPWAGEEVERPVGRRRRRRQARWEPATDPAPPPPQRDAPAAAQNPEPAGATEEPTVPPPGAHDEPSGPAPPREPSDGAPPAREEPAPPARDRAEDSPATWPRR